MYFLSNLSRKSILAFFLFLPSISLFSQGFECGGEYQPSWLFEDDNLGFAFYSNGADVFELNSTLFGETYQDVAHFIIPTSIDEFPPSTFNLPPVGGLAIDSLLIVDVLFVNNNNGDTIKQNQMGLWFDWHEEIIDYSDYSQYSTYNEYNYINTYLPGTIGCASISGQTNYSGNYSIILKIDAWAYLPIIGQVSMGLTDFDTELNLYIQAEDTNTLMDVIVESADLNTLEVGLQYCGLDSLLSNPSGNLTVFAPTDAAFDLLPPAALDALLADIPQFTEILLYHILDGAVYSSEFINQMMVSTLLGEDVNISISADGVFVNEIEIIISDIVVDNGVLHVIDAVLLPPNNEDENNIEEDEDEENIDDTETSVDCQNTNLDQFNLTAVDFEAFDILGNPWNLQDILNSGKTVILEFSATWCPPCWSYSATGTLDEIYEVYGPEGSNQVEVLFIEADGSTNWEDLMGITQSTMGDWVSLITYPIIDDPYGQDMMYLYNGPYYPYILTICPNGLMTESGQVDFSTHESIITSCSCFSSPLPQITFNTYGNTNLCAESDNAWFDISIENLGEGAIESFSWHLSFNGEIIENGQWNEDLNPAEGAISQMESIVLLDPGYGINESGVLEFVIDSLNNEAVNYSDVLEITNSIPTTEIIEVEIFTDDWPEETSFTVFDNNGYEIFSSGQLNSSNSLSTWEIDIPSDICYNVEFYDTYGDGLFASQWGPYSNGNIRIKSNNTIVYEYLGDSDFNILSVDLVSSSEEISNENPNNPNANTTPIWENSCSVNNCETWTFGNDGNVDINFYCSFEGPTGPYNQWAGGLGDGSAADALNSSTNFDGILIVDSDAASAGGGEIENCWVQNNMPIDCSMLDAVSVNFETRYRCFDNGSYDGNERCYVEVSRDGYTWPSDQDLYNTDGGMVYYNGDSVQSRFEVFTEFSTNDVTENPEYISINISDVAAGQSQVYIRFRWVGVWGYSWEIDDISITQTLSNDIAIDNYFSYTDYARTGIYEYGAWPVSQLPEYLQAGVEVKNNGTDSVYTNITMWYSDDNVNGSGLPLEGGQLSESYLSYGQVDTLIVSYEPETLNVDLGMRYLHYNVTTNNGSDDENPIDNYASQSFEITEYSFGRDDGSIDFVGPNYYSAFQDGDCYAASTVFQIFESTTIYGIDIAVMEGSDENAWGELFIGNMSEFEMSQGMYGDIAQTSFNPNLTSVPMNSLDSSNVVWHTVVFNEPVDLEGGIAIYAGIFSDSHEEGGIKYGMSDGSHPNSSFIYFCNEGTVYWTSQTPMIRLNLDPNVSNQNSGCTDEQACNWDIDASIDDGSCEYPFENGYCDCEYMNELGCMDEMACNYNMMANCDYPESLCEYPEEGYDCTGMPIFELQWGCTDWEACNYDENANETDGSCIYPESGFDCFGNCIGILDECGVCEGTGESCAGCNNIGSEFWSNLPSGVYPNTSNATFAEYASIELALHLNEMVEDPATNQLFPIIDFQLNSVEGLPNGIAADEIQLILLPENQVCLTLYGTPYETGIFNIQFTGIATISLFGLELNLNNFTFNHLLLIEENQTPILGCTYEGAANYNPIANMDDDSCQFEGCTDSTAINFSPIFNIDDESCIYSLNNMDCIGDIDFNGVVSTSDLLLLLSSFGQFCD